jgi:hypothetical protein
MRSCGISRQYRFKFAQRFNTYTMFNLPQNPAIIAYTMLWAGFLGFRLSLPLDFDHIDLLQDCCLTP